MHRLHSGRRLARFVRTSLLMACLCASTAAADHTFFGLGLGPAGSIASSATTISPDGQWVAGVWTDPSLRNQFFAWSQGTGMVSRSFSHGGSVESVSNGGIVVGTIPLGATGSAAVAWNPQSNQIVYQSPQGGQGFAITADGSRILVLDETLGLVLMDSDGGNPVPITGFPSGWSSDLGLDATAQRICGARFQSGQLRGFVWTQGQGHTVVDTLPGGAASSLCAMSQNGQHAVGYAPDGIGEDQAVRWSGGSSLESLGALSGSGGCRARAVSASGDAVVGHMVGIYGAFIWNPNLGMRDIKAHLLESGLTAVSEWTLVSAEGISADGRTVVGRGLDPLGREQAWLARVPANCYPNCDNSHTAPVLNVADFTCFLRRFAAGDPYANCDNWWCNPPPCFNVADFTCFLQRFAAGCP